ncbi:DUF1007 family protein [Limoniibacter endophyticus]|uniref:EF-hand domain-containing protein n=1 Tax=Limoniibacter endophyticus TaxID=1565040 RepID=A0A8J3GGE4_9HYPH|nr:DUF1007 family protein [Limoniibacter endophyticus]GHC64389.1 hypothetical protein GCM10010136_06310 [Limoniibacter endophyticus]
MRHALRLVALLAVLIAPAPAFAHPHVFAEARLDVMLEGENVRSLRHLWRFDDLFSSTVILEFDKNGDNVLDPEEMAEVSKVIYDSIGDFDYFQFVTVDGKEIKMAPPDDLKALYQDGQLIIMYESMPQDILPLKGTMQFGVYDPTFYTAIDFVEDANMAVKDLPSRCTTSVVRPDPDEAIAQNQGSLTEAFFNDPNGNDLSKLFATKFQFDCKDTQ